MRISDWSSDVCSSDLPNLTFNVGLIAGGEQVSLDEGKIRASANGKTNIIAATAIARGDLRTLSAEQAARVKDKRSEEHTSELQSLMRISYAVFCLKKKNTIKTNTSETYAT